MTVPLIPLNTGAAIPQIGLGTYPLTDAQLGELIPVAAELGYRHIDTATRYGNEAGVGEGVRRSGLPREEFFVTTKLDGEFQGGDRAVGGLDAALARMGFDYVDLLLIHWPLPARDEYVSTWRTFERLHASGKARAIGVSNFTIPHLERLARETEIVPAVNQVQLSPFITRQEQRAYHATHGIVTESYSPLGGSRATVLSEPAVRAIAAKHGVTPGQVAVRWHVQNGLVVIPKSGNPERMRQNLDVFGFALDDADLAAIATLDRGPGAGVDAEVTGH